jgi:uncharacterized protein (DUF952 family)
MTRMVYHMCPQQAWSEVVAGPLLPAEAARVVPLPLGPDGNHLFPPLV